MKRCPECRRDYYDDTLLYCLDDGNALLEGPAAPFRVPALGESPTDELATVILSEPPASAGGHSLRYQRSTSRWARATRPSKC